MAQHPLAEAADGRNTLVRVFGSVPDDLTAAPRDTTLRRAILDHLLAGGYLSAGRCFLLSEDLRWGEQVYRRFEPRLIPDLIVANRPG